MNGFGGGGRMSGMFPPFVKFILIANVAVFLFQLLFSGYSIGGESLGRTIQELFALIPIIPSDYTVTQELNFWPWQLVSYQFLHGGFWHLFFNMFGIWMFGAELERDWGSARFGTFYLLCGIGAGLLQVFIADVPTVGASGALFGVLLGFGFSYPDRRILMFPFFIPIKAKYFVMIYGGLELINGFTRVNSGVAHFAHIAGALTGILLIKFGKDIGLWKQVQKWFGRKGIPYSGYSNLDTGKHGGEPSSSYGQGFGGGSFGSGAGRGMGNPFGNIRTRMQTRTETMRPPEPAKPKTVTHEIDGKEIPQSRIDEILDKISASGYQSLTDKEKYILTELSKKL
ncbi:MAG: hypothetical protein Kapaf2KO_21660 [Candidatus Kapaibacteriales bacterium]